MSEEPRDLHAVEQVIAAVGGVRQVVQAVWTLARAQQPRVEAAVGEASAYLRWVEELVERLGGGRLDETSERVLWVLVGPERPFCGGLARRLLEQIPKRGSLLLVGHRLVEALPAAGPLGQRVVASLPAAVGPEEIDFCARRVAAALLDVGHAGPVGILHATEGGTQLHESMLLWAGSHHQESAAESYSPPEVVLAAALREALSSRLMVGLAEALRSEIRARLLAADAARQGCDRKLEALRRQWRVSRQESTTNELLELFAGRLAPPG